MSSVESNFGLVTTILRKHTYTVFFFSMCWCKFVYRVTGEKKPHFYTCLHNQSKLSVCMCLCVYVSHTNSLICFDPRVKCLSKIWRVWKNRAKNTTFARIYVLTEKKKSAFRVRRLFVLIRRRRRRAFVFTRPRIIHCLCRRRYRDSWHKRGII